VKVRFALKTPGTQKASGSCPPVWKKIGCARSPEGHIIQRAGRLTQPQGELTLTMSANEAVRKDLLHFMDVLQKQHEQK